MKLMKLTKSGLPEKSKEINTAALREDIIFGIVVDIREMILTLPQEKVNAIIDQCQFFL